LNRKSRRAAVPYKHDNGTWYSDFRSPDPETGRPRRWRLSLGPEVRTAKEAEVAERRLQAGIEAGAVPAQAVPSSHSTPAVPARPASPDLPSAPFSGLAARWLEVAIAPKKKPKTYTSYEYLCRIWLVPFFGDREASTIGPADVEALQAHMRKTPRAKGKGTPPGPKTINEAIGCLSSMYSTAIRWRYVKVNPCDGVDRLGVPEAPIEYYDAEETARWLTRCARTEPAWYSLFYTGFRTGLREGELFALRAEDIAADFSRIDVRRTYGAAAEREEGTGRAAAGYFEVTPKSNKGRTVGISPLLADVLRAHLGTRRTGLVWSVPPREDGDAHVRLSVVLGAWERVTAAVGLPRYSLHSMRHSFASQLVMAGVPLAHIQALLGHSTIRMTERYAHLAPGFASGHVGVLDTGPDTRTAPNHDYAGSRPLGVVGVTGFEPVAPTV
jgi:integrase